MRTKDWIAYILRDGNNDHERQKALAAFIQSLTGKDFDDEADICRQCGHIIPNAHKRSHALTHVEGQK